MRGKMLEQEARAEVRLKRAVGALNLSEIAPATREFVSLEAALQLKEVLDRLQLPPTTDIPDEKARGSVSFFSTPIPSHGRRKCTRRSAISPTIPWTRKDSISELSRLPADCSHRNGLRGWRVLPPRAQLFTTARRSGNGRLSCSPC